MSARDASRSPAQRSAARQATMMADSIGTSHESDMLAWSERQVELLRRVEAGEKINDQVDWPNVIEEVE